MNKNNRKITEDTMINKIQDTSLDFREIYISVDIESTGPIPGEYSMSSVGAFLAGGRTKDGNYVAFDHTDSEKVFYRELKPISEKFDEGAIKVGLLNGFDKEDEDTDGSLRHDWMKEHGDDPATAMQDFADFVNQWNNTLSARPVFMAYPASFDWTFVYWYFRKFDVESPFGFSSVLDLKTYFATKFDKPLTRSTKRYMPKRLFPDLPHTHRADDDAIEQGIMGMNMLMD